MQTDAEKFGLTGPVRQWTRQSFGITTQGQEKVLLNKEVFTFDAAGRQTRVDGYSEENQIVSSGITIYNAAGEKTGERYYAAGNVLLSETDYRYNGLGMVLTETKNDLTAGLVYESKWEYTAEAQVLGFVKTMHSAAGQVSTLTRIGYRYDRAHKLQEEEQTEYKADGTVNFRRVIRYIPNGGIGQDAEYDADNKLTRQVKNRYNASGQLLTALENIRDFDTGKWIKNVTACKYDKAGRLLKRSEPGMRVTYVYTADGKPAEIAEYDYADKPVSKSLHTYDPVNGLHEEMKTLYGDDGTIASSYRYTYAADDKQIAWARYDGNGSQLYRHETLYDERGNKTEETADSTREYPRILYKYAYDARGNHMRTDCFRLPLENAGEAVLAMTYEYDFIYAP